MSDLCIFFACFLASAAKNMRTALYWVITRRVVLICCRRFGISHRSHLQGSPKTVPLGCPETSAINYHYLPHNNPEERISWYTLSPYNCECQLKDHLNAKLYFGCEADRCFLYWILLNRVYQLIVGHSIFSPPVLFVLGSCTDISVIDL